MTSDLMSYDLCLRPVSEFDILLAYLCQIKLHYILIFIYIILY